MINPAELSLQLLLNQLEEELVEFSHYGNIFSKPSYGEIKPILERSLELLRNGERIFQLLSNPPTHFEEQTRQRALGTLHRVINTVKHFYENLEREYPLFLDTLTVFFEPLLDKIRQLEKTLNPENSPQTELDLEDLAYVWEEIVSTLEVYFSSLPTLEEKEM